MAKEVLFLVEDADEGGYVARALLRRYGYEVTRQTRSHMRLTTTEGGEHHVTVPRHSSLRVGTLAIDSTGGQKR